MEKCRKGAILWLICICCHHAVQGRGIPRNGRLKCSGCGSRVARSVRVLRSQMLNGGQMPATMALSLTHGGLVSIARERNYGAGWIAHKFKSIFGFWPPRTVPEPSNPSGELMWWIRKQNIAYAKAHFPKEKKVKPEEKQSTLMSREDWETDL